MHQSIESKVKDRVLDHGPGWCFTGAHFSDLGNDDSIRKALSILQKQNIIRRLTQGVYDYPKTHHLLGIIPPDLTDVARAIADKNGVQIQPAGAYAANLVGVSEHVPGRVVFLTEGPSKRVKIGNQEIIFKKTTTRMMAAAGTKEGLVIQALKNLGRDRINSTVQIKIFQFLNGATEKEIRQNLKFAPQWVRSLVFAIMEFKP